MTLHVVDVSRHQVERVPPFDPAVAQAAGFGALNIALDRGRQEDVLPTWASAYAARARQIGLKVCAYRWLDNRLSGADSAQRAYDRMLALGGPTGMAHSVDIEDNATEQIVRDYCATMTDLLGRPFFLYTGRWWWTAATRNWKLGALAPYLWAAPTTGYQPAYPGDNSPLWNVQYGNWTTLSAMQYSVKPLPGLPGDCSMSAIRDPTIETVMFGTGGSVPSRTYTSWNAAGRPVSGVARPAARLRDLLRGYGYTVYDIGNDDHLRHKPPEDHTPYSDTGWPVDPPLWWITAIDIMPPPSGRGLPSLATLARQIHDDRQAGHPGATWIKYINWEPGDGSCIHCSWQPTHVQVSSTDRGHIHISTLGDVIAYAGADDYDPVARTRGITGGGSEDMVAIWYDGKGYGRGNGVHSSAIESWPEMVELQRLIKAGVVSGSATIQTTSPELSRAYGVMLASDSKAADLDWKAVETAIKDLSARLAEMDNGLPSDAGALVAAITAAVRGDQATLNTNMEKLAAALADKDNGLPTEANVIAQALKQALREGTGVDPNAE